MSLHIEAVIMDTVEDIVAPAWILPKTSCEIARGDKILTPSITENVHDAIMRTSMDSDSIIKAESPDFEKLRVGTGQLSQTLRARLRLAGLEEYMPLILGRRLYVTEQVRFAIVPPATQSGDRICAFSGTPDPFVLR
ncbi:hypothetical protein FHL15_008564 [Xylaria flabelliformis]|uniref:Uncharacterized protein n=1 Tax=Xylaria flabelliformis TaxID=2512241 RepID=A0A553HRN0_9PEZI|nr:hypothetical protein FHL15_008564 [Xylaria flabelliformis]